ncbi:MAG: porin [Pirellulales bacterium]
MISGARACIGAGAALLALAGLLPAQGPTSPAQIQIPIATPVAPPEILAGVLSSAGAPPTALPNPALASQTAPALGPLEASVGEDSPLKAEVARLVREALAEQQKSASLVEPLPPVAEPKPAAASVLVPEPYVVGSDTALKAVWNHGWEVQSANKDFRVHVGGRTHFDGGWFSADDAVQFGPRGIGALDDSVNMRRGRLRVDGTMYEVIDWAAEYDFVSHLVGAANPSVPAPAPTDLWVTFTHLPWVGNFRVGNQKDPIELEHLTSSRWLDFMERSPMFDAFYGRFTNGFVPGLQLFNCTENERATWAVGVFKNTTNPFGFGVGDGDYMIEGRGTVLPIYDADGRYLWHLGLSGSHRDLLDGQTRFVARGSVRNGPPGPFNAVFADTGFIKAESTNIVNAENLVIWGPWTVQAEYSAVWVTDAAYPAGGAGTPLGTVYFQGTYVEALYFLTGENRPYNRKTGVVDRIIPYENFAFVKGTKGPLFSRGAWQVGARYAMLDLNNAGIVGGLLHDYTLGLNWLLNPNMKFQWNYVFTHRDVGNLGSSGDVHAFGMRMAMDF